MAIIKFKSEIIHTSGKLPEIASYAPEFNLVDQDLNIISPANFLGKRKLLNIVPSLDTSVCAQSAKYFNEQAKKYPNLVVLNISADLPFAQKRFCNQEKIHALKTLSLMNNPQFAKDYGVLLMDGPLKGLTARAILILDESNKVLYSELVEELTQEPNYGKATAFL